MAMRKIFLFIILLFLVFTFINPIYVKEPEKWEAPFDKYPFIIPATIIVTIFVIGFLLLTKFFPQMKPTITMFTSIIFLILLIFSGASGFWLLFFKEIKINFLGRDLKYWHILGSYLMVFFAIIHFSQSCLLIHHTNKMIKDFFNKFKTNKDNMPKQ
jgi:amino acid transporter